MRGLPCCLLITSEGDAEQNNEVINIGSKIFLRDSKHYEVLWSLHLRNYRHPWELCARDHPRSC